MNITQKVLDYVKAKYSTVGDNPFSDGDSIVLRNMQNKKWYGIIIRNLPFCKLGLRGKSKSDILNLKCDPMLSFEFIDNKGVFPAYHMNKIHWISVLLDGSVDMEKISFLIDISYNMVDKKPR
jgi:predicted DNA-binding protein (MmcQ/YjbR family)